MSTETKKSTEAGMTAIEIAATVMIIGIVLAISIPATSNAISAYNLRSAANHMAERIAAVRALAMAKNRNVTFSFNNASLLYGFDFDATEGDGVPDQTDPDDPGTRYNWGTLPTGIRATFPNNAPIKVTFNSRGEMPIGMAEQTIVLGNGTQSRTVRVNLRGKVSVE
ncbi:MAG: GspH/FimT family pseudopilin [Acidobacteriota bacterium]